MEKVIANPRQCKTEILNSITKATKKICLAVAYFTDTDIADALIDAHSRKVSIHIVLDNHEMNNQIISLFANNGIKCQVFQTKEGGIMHHKFCIIDDRLAIHGSYNYTKNASTKNKESITITDNPASVSEFKKEFDNLYHEDIEEVSKKPYDDFIEKLNEVIVLSIEEYDKEEIQKKGYNASEKSLGSKHIFLNNLNSILTNLKTKISNNERTKVIISSRIQDIYNKTINLEQAKMEDKTSLLTEATERKKSQLNSFIREKNNTIQESKIEKQKLSNSRSEKLIETKHINEKISAIDRIVTLRNFWTTPTHITIFLLLILFTYLSFYFASAIWKIFFEETQIRNFLLQGITPAPPPLLDLKVYKYFNQSKGWEFTTFAYSFFIIPILFINAKHFKTNLNKYISIVIHIFGIFIIDVIIAFLINKHTFETQNLVVGKITEWDISLAFKSFDFWLIFIFGAIPLWITIVLIDYLVKRYKYSSPTEVEKEKLRKKKELEQEKIDIQKAINLIESEIEQINVKINGLQSEIASLNQTKHEEDIKLGDKIAREKEVFSLIKHNYTEILNNYLSLVSAGSIEIIKDICLAQTNEFKNGFAEFITYYFSEKVAQEKLTKIEQCYEDWLNKSFN